MTIRFAVCVVALSGLFVPTTLVGLPVGTDGADPVSQPADFHVLRAAEYDAMTKIAAPPSLRGERVPTKTATIEVTYQGFSTQARAAFQRAIDIWSAVIDSSVTIRIQAQWVPLAQQFLGGAGANSVWRDFAGGQPNTWYPDALADALAGFDLGNGSFDIITQFNSARSDWYLGTDGNTPSGQFDLVTVVLHEIGHGLGMSGTMNVPLGTTQGQWGVFGTTVTGFPNIYDRFGENGSGTALLDAQSFPNGSVLLANVLQSNDLFWNGGHATAANGGARPPLFAPNPWLGGSSFSHFDESSFPPGQPGSLMTPALAMSEVVHTPDDLFLCLLEDIGWETTASCEGGCTPGPTTMCLNNGRFRVTVGYETAQGVTGDGQVAQGVGTDDSGIIYFFNPQNYEMLIKVLDNCNGFSNHFWVFAAATTDLGWEMTVEDTQTGQAQRYSNPLGQPSPAITDTQAFATCP